ncbi:SLC13 family permease [Qipengyuania vesicularis]|uniref:SLC13 family permease n=1 Tax=Qipengyuania vesicularis TaxID=2867232 RepID=UPI001C869F70|nr:DASS family sodium-coupled anion symporter [Qipengyuania vesicularis]MBX7526030.1 DASS family sodium-coupled anion symporter [Qipengyuania vesicularis]
MTTTDAGPRSDIALHQRIGLVLGPVAALGLLAFFHPEGLSEAGVRTAAIAALMAIWWGTEAVPISVTAFLPMVLFPFLGVLPMAETAPLYAHPIIYLFFGGFVMALAIERSGLHRRVALRIFHLAGMDGRSLIGGFMLAAALISMWISNTSTALMLLPIAMSVIVVIREGMSELTPVQRSDFETALLLGLAYGATLGGVATLVGTPPNAFMSGFLESNYGITIDFARWMLVGVPVTVIMLPLTWIVLTRLVFKVGFRSTDDARAHLARLGSDLGKATTAEKRVGILFLVLVAAWILRSPLEGRLGLEGVTDAGIAMAVALAAFILPAGSRSGALVCWEDTRDLPWGVLILFGGGLALAGAMTQSGLTQWIGQSLAPLGAINIAVLVVAATLLVIFLTELTSNLATTATFLPVMAAVAVETGQDPLLFVVPVTLAASCAFMLPVATPPNAIVFSSGSVSIPRMMRAGVVLNLIGVAVLTVVSLYLVPMVFG